MQSIGLHCGKNRPKCNNVGQHYTALGVQRNLLSTGGTLRMIVGNKEEREKKSEVANRGTQLPSLSYDYTHQRWPHNTYSQICLCSNYHLLPFILEGNLRTWTSRIIPHLSMFGVTSVNPRLNPNVWLLVTFLERNTIQSQTPRTENKNLFRQNVKRKNMEQLWIWSLLNTY